MIFFKNDNIDGIELAITVEVWSGWGRINSYWLPVVGTDGQAIPPECSFLPSGNLHHAFPHRRGIPARALGVEESTLRISRPRALSVPLTAPERAQILLIVGQTVIQHENSDPRVNHSRRDWFRGRNV